MVEYVKLHLKRTQIYADILISTYIFSVFFKPNKTRSTHPEHSFILPFLQTRRMSGICERTYLCLWRTVVKSTALWSRPLESYRRMRIGVLGTLTCRTTGDVWGFKHSVTRYDWMSREVILCVCCFCWVIFFLLDSTMGFITILQWEYCLDFFQAPQTSKSKEVIYPDDVQDPSGISEDWQLYHGNLSVPPTAAPASSQKKVRPISAGPRDPGMMVLHKSPKALILWSWHDSIARRGSTVGWDLFQGSFRLVELLGI